MQENGSLVSSIAIVSVSSECFYMSMSMTRSTNFNLRPGPQIFDIFDRVCFFSVFFVSVELFYFSFVK